MYKLHAQSWTDRPAGKGEILTRCDDLCRTSAKGVRPLSWRLNKDEAGGI